VGNLAQLPWQGKENRLNILKLRHFLGVEQEYVAKTDLCDSQFGKFHTQKTGK
jgi:hypothetical protein